MEFFSSLNEEQIDTLSSISTVHFYQKDYIVYYEKKQNPNLLFLTDGLAKAYKIDKRDNEIFLHYIYKDSLLSEVSNVDSEKLVSFSNIEIIEDATVLSINYQKFHDCFLKKNLLCLEFANEVIKHTQQLQSIINKEFIFDSVAKVAMMIASDLEMFNKLKRHDISLVLHIQPATLSRVLNRLKRNKIIDIIHGQISIIDSAALEGIYEDLE
jgi:CRP/FNR family transcriptional regulator